MPIAVPILIVFGLIVLLGRSSHATVQGVPVTSPSVQAWRESLLALGPDVPIQVSEAWFGEESEGNVCAIGDEPPPGATQPQEYGLAQFNAKDPSNLAIATPEQLRPSGLCGVGPGQWQKQLRPLTEAEKLFHASKNLELMRHCRDKALSLLAIDQSQIDQLNMWRFAKCYHASSAIGDLIPAIRKTMKRNPGWDEFQDIASRIALAHGYSQSYLDRVWLNANRVGNSLIRRGNVS